MTEMIVNPGFRLSKFHSESWDSEYADYRKAWTDYPKLGFTSDFPLNLDIETTNRCNLKCPFCVREEMDEGVGDFNPLHFEKIIGEIMGGKVKAMKFNWRGEPTLFRDLPKFIRMAKRAGVLETMINTNGTLLDLVGEELIKVGLDRLIVSIDSIDPKIYREQRVGAELNVVLDNLREFLKLRDEMDSKRPYVRVQKIDMPETRSENYIGFFEEMGVDAVAINTYKEKHTSKLGDWKALQCAQPFQRLLVSWKGDFYPCCQGQLFKPLGNVKDESVYQAWHSPTMKMLRAKHKEGRQGEIKQCAECETTRPY